MSAPASAQRSRQPSSAARVPSKRFQRRKVSVCAPATSSRRFQALTRLCAPLAFFAQRSTALSASSAAGWASVLPGCRSARGSPPCYRSGTLPRRRSRLCRLHPSASPRRVRRSTATRTRSMLRSAQTSPRNGGMARSTMPGSNASASAQSRGESWRATARTRRRRRRKRSRRLSVSRVLTR